MVSASTLFAARILLLSPELCPGADRLYPIMATWICQHLSLHLCRILLLLLLLQRAVGCLL